MEKKLFEFTIEEHNCEQEYSHQEYVWAVGSVEANRLARGYAKDFYEGGHRVEKNHWSNYTVDWIVFEVREVKSISIYPINSERVFFNVTDGRQEVS
jgi:hypothetical protein